MTEGPQERPAALEPGHAYLHEHGIPHEHARGHSHSHTQTRAVINRLARAIGHLERVKAMVEEGRDCAEVLIQLAAVRSAINNTGKVILKDHLEHCIVDAVQTQDFAAIDELNRAIEQFVK
jgi:DNA-binding FrmR family transcriptional regulator